MMKLEVGTTVEIQRSDGKSFSILLVNFKQMDKLQSSHQP